MAAGSGKQGDPLYYVWAACWSVLSSSVVLFTLVASLTWTSGGWHVRLIQAGQFLLFLFLLWGLPKICLSLMRSASNASVRAVVRRDPNVSHTEESAFGGFKVFLSRWLRMVKPRPELRHESLRITPLFILAMVLLSWDTQVDGKASVLWPGGLAVLMLVLLLFVAPVGIYAVCRDSKSPS